MAIFTALAGLLLSGTFLAGSALATSVVAGALGVATAIGLSYAAQALAGKPEQAPDIPADNFSVQTTVKSSGDVPRSFNVGYSCTAGSRTYLNTWGTDGSTPNAYLTQVFALSDLPGHQLLKIWVYGTPCPLASTPHPTYGYPVPKFRKNGRDYLWVKFHDGTQTTADSFLTNTVRSSDRPYQSTRVGVGVCYAIVTALVNETLFPGVPTFKFELSGVPLYDPSKDSTVGGSGSHRWSDKSTWGGDGDNLPAVQAYNVLRGITFNGTWLYGLQSMTAARLPVTNWIAQIAKCRAEIEGVNGPEPTYRTGGQINVDAQIANTLETIMTGCQGKISESGGFYKTYVGTPDEPVITIDDGIILSTEEQHFAPFFGLADSINGITATYPSPAEGWNPKAAPPLYDTGFEARDGDRRLLANPKFDFVPYDAQVQRLQKSALQEARRERRHTAVLPPKLWWLEPGNVIAWNSARNGYVAKWFRIDGAIDKANLDLVVDLTEVDPSDYDFNHGTEFRPVTVGPTEYVPPPPQGVKDWGAEKTTIDDADGVQRRPAIRMTWDGDMPGVVGITFQVRLKEDQSPVVSGSTDQLDAGAIIITQSILPATTYEVRGQYIPTDPRDMLWSDWLQVTTDNVGLSSKDLDPGLAQYITSYIQREQAAVRKAMSNMANLIAQIDAASDTNKDVLRTDLARSMGQATAFVRQTIAVATGPKSAIATALQELRASVEGIEAGATARFVVGVTPEGAEAAYELRTIAEDAQAGLTVVAFDDGAGGASGQLWLDADKLYFGKRGVVGFVPIVIIDNTITPARLIFNADLIASGSITGEMLAVRTVQTENIAIGGVSLDNIIDGSTSKTDFSATPAFTLASGTMASRSVEIRSGKASVSYSAGFNGSADRASLPVRPTVTITLYVDGVLRATWRWSWRYFRLSNTAEFFELIDPFTVDAYVAGLSQGNHTFQLRVNATQTNTPILAGFLKIVDYRR